MTTIIIPDSVEAIGSSAFSYCSKLTEVKLNEASNLKNIGSYAFSYCNALASVTLPSELRSIGSNAFTGSPNLAVSWYFGQYIAAEAFGSVLKNVIVSEGVSGFGGRTFWGMSNFEITLPSTLEAVEWDTFYNCANLSVTWYYNNNMAGAANFVKHLKAVIIPETMTIIGSSAFAGGTALESVTMHEGITLIGANAFSGCTTLGRIEIPESVAAIWSNAFYNCSSLSIYAGTTSKPEGWFSDWNPSNRPVFWGALRFTYGDAEYAVEKGSAVLMLYKGTSSIFTVPVQVYGNQKYYAVTAIGNNAFYDCKSLVTVNIPDGVVSIGSNAFYYCDYLKTVNISDSVVSMGSYAFSYCTELQNLSLPSGLKEISDGLFNNCYRVSGITLHEGIIRIGNSAFKNCYKLTGMNFPDSLTTVGQSAFYGCSGLIGALQFDFNVTSIGEYAFSYCINLTTIYVRGITKFEDGLFYNCSSLQTISTGCPITSIGSYAFWGCNSFNSFTIESSVTNIGSYAFANMSSLKSIYVQRPSASGITTLGNDAFYQTNLTNIYINSGLQAYRSAANWVNYSNIMK